MGRAGVSLGGLGLLATGAIFAWSGVNDPDGGPVQVTRDILTGNMPTAGLQRVTQPFAANAAQGAFDAVSNATRGNDPRLQDIQNNRAIAGGSGVGAKVVAVAQTYLGVPYSWAGASKNGIDCSGLVLVAYRDGAGISLPHLATAQMARGKRIPREQIQPGDLVGWGAPGNYPHIALAVSADEVIVAPTFGQKVQYQKLWEQKVSGFGFPDIVRIL